IMRRQQSGRILTVASRQGVEPAANISAYNASKAALVSLTKTIALELKGTGITANTVLPGAMATPNNSGANLVDPAQVAALLVHLAGDSAADITGAAIPVYGSQERGSPALRASVVANALATDPHVSVFRRPRHPS